MSTRSQQQRLSQLAPDREIVQEIKFKYDVSGWKIFGLFVILGLIIAGLLYFFKPDVVRTRTPAGIPTDVVDIWRLVFFSILGSLALLGIMFWIKVIKH